MLLRNLWRRSNPLVGRHRLSLWQILPLLASRTVLIASGARASTEEAATAIMSDAAEINLSNDQWRAKLSKEQFRVLREKGTVEP